MMIKRLMVGTAVLVASTGAAFAQDAAAGETAFTKCQPCHSVGEDAKNKIGPVLNGLDGRMAGTVANAMYSKGMKDSGITWNEATFKGIRQQPGRQSAGHDDVACRQGRKRTWRPLGVSSTVWTRWEEEMTGISLPALCFCAFVAATGLVELTSEQAGAEQASSSPLQLELKIFLSDVEGRIDHLAIDLSRKRLFVAELG